MAISLPDARQLSDEVLEVLRLRALRGCELGFTQADVADLLGVSRETVSRWWTAYATGGPDAIPSDRTGRPVGPGRTLSEDQARHIRQQIDDQGLIKQERRIYDFTGVLIKVGVLRAKPA